MSSSAYSAEWKPQIQPLRPRLGQLEIELTERCNNNCIHCCINLPANDRQAKKRELSTAQLQDLLTQAANLGCLQVRFTGGEPLLRSDFETLYLFARRLGMSVVLFTNARLITPELAALLARIPPRKPVEVTVYGMHAESYDAVTQIPGSFAQFWRGVNLLLEYKVPFIVKQSLLPSNLAEIDEFEAWAGTIPWLTHTPAYAINFELRHRRDDPAKNAALEALRFSPQASLDLRMRHAESFQREQAEFRAKKFMQVPGDSLFNCGACSGRSGCVDAYGRLQPCLTLRDPALSIDLTANAPSPDRLADLGAAVAGFTKLSELRAENPAYLERCARCFLKGFCEQCPAKAWIEHGALDTPVEYLCQVAHTQARSLGWLKENEFGWDARPDPEEITDD